MLYNNVNTEKYKVLSLPAVLNGHEIEGNYGGYLDLRRRNEKKMDKNA
jgi:hypothetical protein